MTESLDDVLVRGPEAVLIRADWVAELTRVPADQRVAFATGPQRVQTGLNNILVNRTLAHRARERGIDKDPVVERRLVLEVERALAGLMVERIESEAGAEFDRAMERNVARARELYLVNRAKYVVPEEIDVSHILFDIPKRGSRDAALAAANDARAKLLAGADITELAPKLSDDPSVTRNKGRLDFGPRGRFDPAFETAAFALKNPGDVSEPVATRFGYHVIKLEGRKPGRDMSFDEVRSQILTEMRQKHVNDARESIVAAIRRDPRLQVNQEAVDRLVVKVDAAVPPLNTGSPPAVSPPK
ncbi:MAG: peptidylprolyl isomerase [Vicinamibacterales bacterium]